LSGLRRNNVRRQVQASTVLANNVVQQQRALAAAKAAAAGAQRLAMLAAAAVVAQKNLVKIAVDAHNDIVREGEKHCAGPVRADTEGYLPYPLHYPEGVYGRERAGRLGCLRHGPSGALQSEENHVQVRPALRAKHDAG
jgi:hypothetical protein